VSSLHIHPPTFGGAENLVQHLSVLFTSVGHVNDPMRWLKLAGNEVTLVTGPGDEQLIPIVGSSLYGLGRNISKGGVHPVPGLSVGKRWC